MLLAVVNESTSMKEREVQRAATACAAQLKLHMAPAWGLVPADVVYYADKKAIPDHAEILTVLDSADQAGFLGYHRVTPDDQPYSRVFVDPILNHGGELLTSALSVSAVMSHEACEWFIDPFVNLWADGPDGEYAVEVCDPVDEDCYELDGVSVSSFVFRRFYDPRAPATAQLDYLKRITRPFTPTPGGQVQVRKNGTISVIGGASVPAWKQATRAFPAARSTRRSHRPSRAP